MVVAIQFKQKSIVFIVHEAVLFLYNNTFFRPNIHRIHTNLIGVKYQSHL